MYKRTRSIKTAVMLVCILLILTACTTANSGSAENAIRKNVETKQKAMDTADQDMYMSTVTQNDYYYKNEQVRWFTEMVHKGIQKVTITVDEVKTIDDTTAVATIHQTHINGENFDFTWPALYKLENGNWVDCGYNFESVDTGKFTVMYMEGETRVNDFIIMMN